MTGMIYKGTRPVGDLLCRGMRSSLAVLLCTPRFGARLSSHLIQLDASCLKPIKNINLSAQGLSRLCYSASGSRVPDISRVVCAWIPFSKDPFASGCLFYVF